MTMDRIMAIHGETTGVIIGEITGAGILAGTIGASCGSQTFTIHGTTLIVTTAVTATTDIIIMDTITTATIATEGVHIHTSMDKEGQHIEIQA